MIYHYLKIAFRNLIKYKTQSIVSIVGLAIGFTCFALSALWIRYEMTYDTGKTHYTFSFIFYTFILHEYRLFILLIRYLSFIYNII